MKKWLRLGLCLGLLTVALTCSALAATEGYTEDSAGTVTYADGKYTASYTETMSDKQYALLVVKGTPTDYSVSEDTIMYIDQKAAGADGISFDFIPKSTPDCVVLLGGEFAGEDSPVVLGTLKGQGVTIEGSVKYQGNDSSAVVQLRDKNTNEVLYETVTNTDGTYSIGSVATGEYNLYITKQSYLSYTKAIEVAEDMAIDQVDISNLAGDINDNGKVNNQDLSILLQNYNSEDKASDINCNGKVNSADLSALLGSFNASDYTE